MRISDWSSDVCSSDLSAFDIKFAFNKWTLGDAFCRDVLGLTDAQLDDMSFDMLAALGFTRAEIDAANTYVCGAMTVEGAQIGKASRRESVCQSVKIRVVVVSLNKQQP